MLEGYYIVENSGVVPAERRFRFKDLKAWGYDLHLGTIEGERAYFVSKAGERQEGETYTIRGREYHIDETQKAIPKNARLLARIVIEKGRPYLEFWLEEGEQSFPLAKEDPGIILHRFWTGKGFNQLEKYVWSVGLTTDFFKDRVFVKSLPLPYEEYPPKVRRVLREVRDLHRDMTGFGRFVFQYYGEKGKAHSYRLWWLLPTIHLFDVEVSNEVDKILAMLD
ncbi:TIGR00703 family protein [Thermococcus sp. GR6]|uniref:TIGR00703 family protein n=1 Tax=Thermococcus sp. GR6 TaxID=1638256 RepID=UPI001431E712|nr:TIGR00703 family protein [Thermococcus sp. GR6]NJE43495.1 TIGR00703 family protein [Thermococcus sp. GR6]